MDNLTFLENRNVARDHQTTVAVVSIPCNHGSQNAGTNGVLKYLLQLGLEKALTSCGFKTVVVPEIKSSPEHTSDIAIISDISLQTRKVVASELSQGHQVVTLGGDHSIAIGSIAGFTEAFGKNKNAEDMGVVWIDAHADINTHETSLTGNIHGMVSSTILGFGNRELTDLITTKIKKENILYIGLRDIDQAEVNMLRKEKLAVVTMHDITEHGLSIVMKKIDALNTKKIWISLDVDTIDGQYAPASAMVAPGGLSYREVVSLLTYIGKTSDVAGLDVVEMTPRKDVEKKTGLLVLELIAAAFGGKYDWYRRYMEKNTTIES